MHYDKPVDLKTYIKRKIEMLEDLGINLNKVRLDYIKSLKSEVQVDNYVHDLIVMKEVY